MFGAFLFTTNIMIYEVQCNINTNVLIPTHRSWRHSLSASLEDRAPWRNPPARLHQSTDNGPLSDGHSGHSDWGVFLIEIRVSQSHCDIFVRQSMDDGLTNGMLILYSAGAFPKINLEQAGALLQQEYSLTDVPNDQCEYWGADLSQQEWQPRWSMGCESVVWALFNLSHVSLRGAVRYVAWQRLLPASVNGI